MKKRNRSTNYEEVLLVRISDDIKNAYKVLSKRIKVTDGVRLSLKSFLNENLTEEEKRELNWSSQ